MNIESQRKLQLEVLISTMQKNSLKFLDSIFKNCNVSRLKLLIINQTDENNILNSEEENIRVINVFEKGISKSRNLALKNAIGDICLFTDDDVVFQKDFDKIIIDAFNSNRNAGMLHFKVLDFEGNDYRLYPEYPCKHNLKSIKGVLSIEIVINRKQILNANLKFDERFGLGGVFETGEEYLFSRSIIKKGIPVYFHDDYIVSHKSFNSGRELGSDKIVYARAALNYSIYKNLVYFWIFRYLYFLLKTDYIKLNQLLSKFKVALNGIKDFKIADGK